MPDHASTTAVEVLRPGNTGDQRGTIRPLRREDREPIFALVQATGVFTGAEVGIALELVDAALASPAQGDYIVRVYERGTQVLGYTCFGPTPGTEGTYDLYWIAVDPLAQGSGVGRELDEDVVDQVRARNGRMIVAETSSRPAYDGTRAFYRRRGYQESARLRDYYRPGDDLVVFVKAGLH